MEEIRVTLSYIWQVIGLIVGSTFVIQISPWKINPWGWFLKRLGTVVNEEMTEKIDGISKEVVNLEEKVENLEEDMDENNTKQNRRRILRFSDECRREEKHSMEHFNEILDDIKEYKQYCEDHPKFKNDKCSMSIDFVEDAYKHCQEHNDFL